MALFIPFYLLSWPVFYFPFFRVRWGRGRRTRGGRTLCEKCQLWRHIPVGMTWKVGLILRPQNINREIKKYHCSKTESAWNYDPDNTRPSWARLYFVTNWRLSASRNKTMFLLLFVLCLFHSQFVNTFCSKWTLQTSSLNMQCGVEMGKNPRFEK